jgi:hypothetical protein
VYEIVTKKHMCKNLYRLAQVTVALLWYEMYCRISVHKELPDWTYDFARQALHILVGVLQECVDYEHGRLLELLTVSNKSVEYVWWLVLET